MMQCELPKIDIHTILNFGKRFTVALLTILRFFQNKNYLNETLYTISLVYIYKLHSFTD